MLRQPLARVEKSQGVLIILFGLTPTGSLSGPSLFVTSFSCRGIRDCSLAPRRRHRVWVRISCCLGGCFSSLLCRIRLLRSTEQGERRYESCSYQRQAIPI